MTPSPTVVLNMIVKDEAETIEDCLRSVLPYIHHWVIVDTGSTDGTQDRIRGFFAQHPCEGHLYEKPWMNFAHNRNEAYQLAVGKADYALFMDADDRFHPEPDFTWPATGAEAYGVRMQRGNGSYWNLRLVSALNVGAWTGVVHEFFELAGNEFRIEQLSALSYIQSGSFGARSKDPATYEKDAALLVAELGKNPQDTRSWFYLAQSYRDAGQLERAEGAFIQRIEMGGWEEEVYCALVELGKVQMQLNRPWAVPMQTFLSAYDLMPHRLEAIYQVVHHSRVQGQYALGFALTELPHTIRHTSDWLMVEPEIYAWRFLDERAKCAIGLENWSEAHRLYVALLAEDVLPVEDRPRIEELVNRLAEELATHHDR